jgi:anti-sigma regulatory factor (Ser/Thr protein kinase)/anti-anti-sigma regulatory factor
MTTDDHARPAPDGARSAPDGQPARDNPILDQAFDAGSLYALRAAVAAHATEAGLAPGRADDLVIAVHELAANAVRHGAGHGRLRIWRSEAALRCEITDDGLPEAPKQAAEPWRAEPGHGLSLVRQVADQTTVQTGRDGTSATISFALAEPKTEFRLTRTETNGCTVLTVTGPLDLTSASQLTKEIQTETRLILDLSALTGWDSAGLAALILAQQRISAVPQARMILAGLPAHLRNHEAIAGRFTLAGTTKEAIKNLSEP